MAAPFQQYKNALDRLRGLRRLAEDTEEREAAIHEEQDVWWDEMSDPERAEARKLSWRSWPDKYDDQQKGLEG